MIGIVTPSGSLQYNVRYTSVNGPLHTTVREKFH